MCLYSLFERNQYTEGVAVPITLPFFHHRSDVQEKVLRKYLDLRYHKQGVSEAYCQMSAKAMPSVQCQNLGVLLLIADGKADEALRVFRDIPPNDIERQTFERLFMAVFGKGGLPGIPLREIRAHASIRRTRRTSSIDDARTGVVLGTHVNPFVTPPNIHSQPNLARHSRARCCRRVSRH